MAVPIAFRLFALAVVSASNRINDTVGKLQLAADDALARYGMRFLEVQPLAVDNYGAYLLTESDNIQDRL